MGANPFTLVLFLLPTIHLLLQGFDMLESGVPGRECSVHGVEGVCVYSMVCTYAGGRHLGTCRDRFLFGSCCRLPQQATLGEWEEGANSRPVPQVCGRRWEEVEEAQGRVQGGQAANRTAWPWQAGLRLRRSSSFPSSSSSIPSSHHCGAVLLSHHWVATAAHCVYKRTVSKLLVVLGDHDNTQPEEGEVARGVDRVLLHPKYSPSTLANDLALLRLDLPVTFSRYILPICLPSPGLSVSGRRGHVTGWGSTWQGGPRPHTLNQVEVPLLSTSECNSLFKLAAVEDRVEEDIWVGLHLKVFV